MSEKFTMDKYLELSNHTENTDYKAIAARMSKELYVKLDHGVSGLVTESGELRDALKKHAIYGKEIDLVNIAEEVGDVLWYAALILRTLDLSFEDVAKINIDKLKARFPNKFTELDALSRDLDKERILLEDGVDDRLPINKQTIIPPPPSFPLATLIKESESEGPEIEYPETD